jgi:hypothetical protein
MAPINHTLQLETTLTNLTTKAADMKRFTLLALLAGAFALSACSEQSIDRSLNGDNVAGSMVQGEGASGTHANEDVNNGRVRVQPRWQNVLDLRGQSDRRSRAFSVDSDRWTISWKTQPGSESGAEFMIFLYDQQNPGDPLVITTSPENDMAEMEGAGVFYVEVVASQPYTIEVKEYK